MSKHRVRTHHWREGRLAIEDLWFDLIEQAMSFADNSDADNVKVYNENGILVKAGTPAVQLATYA